MSHKKGMVSKQTPNCLIGRVAWAVLTILETGDVRETSTPGGEKGSLKCAHVGGEDGSDEMKERTEELERRGVGKHPDICPILRPIYCS